MNIVNKWITYLFDVKPPLAPDQAHFLYSIAMDYDAKYQDAISVMGVNMRDDVLAAMHGKNSNITRLEILQSRMEQVRKTEPVLIKASEDLSRFNGSKCDVFVLDSCLQYMLRPVAVLKNSLEIGSEVLCIIKNYASFKHRLHFAINGNFNFVDIGKSWESHAIIRPFSFKDFIQTCDREHIFVKKALYLNSKGELKDAMESPILTNIYLDEVAFILSKL